MQSAALYIRVSTDDQTEYSPSAQRKALLDYAKKNSYHVDKELIFVDEGYSGKKAEKRPAFMNMIGLAKTKEKPFNTILVHKYDRFARNREDSVVYKSMLKRECGVKVVSITESLDGDDKLTIIIEAILEAMAEYYSINLAEEVKKGMTEKAHKGGFQTSPPLGYRIDEGNNTLQIVNEEAAHVRYIFEQFVVHNKSKSQITRQLNNIGVKSKRGNSIDLRNIDYILQNPVYIGKVRWTPTGKVKRNIINPDTIIADGQHEPIVSAELFQKAAEKNAAARKIYKPRQRSLDECGHWLSGLFKCSKCGSSLTFTGMRVPSPAFQCKNYTSSTCNVSHSLSIKKAERAVKGELIKALSYCDGSDFHINVTRTDVSQDEINILRKKIKSLDTRLARAKEAYLAEIDSIDEYKKNKAGIEQQIRETSDEIERLLTHQPTIIESGFLDRVKSVLDILNSDCNIQAKQKAVRSIIEKIIYDKPNLCLDVFYWDV